MVATKKRNLPDPIHLRTMREQRLVMQADIADATRAARRKAIPFIPITGLSYSIKASRLG